MTDEKKNNQDPATIREQVEKRKQELSKMAENDGSSKQSNRKPSSQFVLQCLECNELGDGILYIVLNGENILHNAQTGENLLWNGQFWERDTLGVAYQACEEVANCYLEERSRIGQKISNAARDGNKDEQRRMEKIKSKIDKRLDRIRSTPGRSKILTIASQGKQSLAITGDQLDANPYLLACQNGVLDLRTGGLRQGRREDYLSIASPCEWKGIDAEAPAWDKALLEIFNQDQEMVNFMQRVFGCSLIGSHLEDAIFVLSGSGRNGKTLLVETIRWILGDLAGPIPSELLLDQGKSRSSAGPSPDVMRLKGLRMAIGTETDEGRKISPAQVKWLTGGDTLLGRNPNDKYFTEFNPTHTLFLLTNNKPHAPADDFAFWERLYLIPFELSFVNREPEEKHERRQDRTLKSKFHEEASGILAWIVRGCLQYQQQGLAPPSKVKAAVEEYRQEEDIVGDWIEERCVVSNNEDISTTANRLYEDFDDWWQSYQGSRTPTATWWGRKMGKKFNKVKKHGTKYYLGITIQPS